MELFGSYFCSTIIPTVYWYGAKPRTPPGEINKLHFNPIRTSDIKSRLTHKLRLWRYGIRLRQEFQTAEFSCKARWIAFSNRIIQAAWDFPLRFTKAQALAKIPKHPRSWLISCLRSYIAKFHNLSCTIVLIEYQRTVWDCLIFFHRTNFIEKKFNIDEMFLFPLFSILSSIIHEWTNAIPFQHYPFSHCIYWRRSIETDDRCMLRRYNREISLQNIPL